jgi:hypothetical protein
MTEAKSVNQMLQQLPKMLHKRTLGTVTLASTTKTIPNTELLSLLACLRHNGSSISILMVNANVKKQ